MRIAIDCDDAAFDFKDAIYEHLKSEGYDITDLKYSADHDCDYPDIAFNLAEKVADKTYDRAVSYTHLDVYKRQKQRKRVDFPEPEEPITATTSPRFT